MRCQIKKQITVNVEDRPGALAHVAKVLSDARVNIRDISSSDFRKQGMIRIIPDHPSECEKALRNARLIPISVDVVAVELKDNPGSLTSITTALALCNVNIEYLYGTTNPFEPWNIFSFFNRYTDRIRLVLKVSDVSRTIQVLTNIK